MRGRFLATAIAAAAIAFGVPSTAFAQRFQVTGPNECLNCHDHEAERTWYEKQEMPEVRKLFPDKGANAGHINALKQLETPKSNDYAKAIGLKDKYDLKGSCVQCHGTVFGGDANAGVSCESCHGAASGYLKPHQTKGTYDQSVAQFGMTKLVGNLAGWAQQCTTCHVMTDQKLIAAGHPAGNDFDLGKKYGPVSLHFKKKYSAADVSAIGRSQVDAILKKRGGAAPAAAATPAAAAPAPAPAAPAPAPAAPVTAPVQTTMNGRGGVPAPPAASSARGTAPAPPAPAAAPRPALSAAPAAVVAAPVAPAAAPVAPAPVASPVVAPAVALVAPPAAEPAAAVAPPPPPPPAAAAPVAASLPAGVAAVQGRVIAALTDLLKQGASVPVHTGTPSPTLVPYSGPDAALLELQREAIALALDTLGQAPAQPAAR